jgi:alpha-amylase/alpha-mannosidase (GH57 family)
MEHFLCIHGHFYQPPRENPWLEAIEIQDGAYPYHDWNERITAECYAPNAAARILDEKRRITDIVSNYARMSFNVGPTLLSWMEHFSPSTYEAVLKADAMSHTLRSGHGAAIAQAYGHIILPLANSRDKRTQCIWGLRDFEHRFQRRPEGMWLPETAVDLETLELLASLGIAFTILSPHQAKRVRGPGASPWRDVAGGRIDPSRPYLCRLPSGKSITLFFYDGPVSRAVAFEGLLRSGEDFAHRLLSGFSERRRRAQLMHIATDGESYGHHHRFGEMALAYALDYIEKKKLARITNYGEFLELEPPRDEVEVIENTSWSCAHGVERWRSDCGCTTGSTRGWTQRWRAPLREALDWLRDEVIPGFEDRAAGFFADPWGARDQYIDVIYDRTEESVERFLAANAVRSLREDEKVTAIKLMELGRHAMLMFTSCGWFFDELSRVETVQVMNYAGRVIQLAEELFGTGGVEGEFLDRLARAKSNIPQQGNGADIYRRQVKPRAVDLKKVVAHYAISSLFEDYPEDASIFCYDIKQTSYRRLQAGTVEFVTGRCTARSHVTWESDILHFNLLHLGTHDFNCGVSPEGGSPEPRVVEEELTGAFESGSFSDLVLLMDKHYGPRRYGLEDLFKEEQRKILNTLISGTLEEFEASYRQMYENNRPLMYFLEDTEIPIPRAFLTAAEFILNLDLKRMLQEEAEASGIQEILSELDRWKLTLDTVDLEFAMRRTLEREMQSLRERPLDLPLLTNIVRLVDITRELPFQINFWLMENIFYELATAVYPDVLARGGGQQWQKLFRQLGELLNFNLGAVLPKSAR